MEAAGGAVGFVSLGIEVCQGLLSYYNSWKGYNSDIDGVYDSITELSKTLTLLIPSLEPGNLDEERSARVKAVLSTCEDALEELSDLLKRLRSHREPEGLRWKTWVEVQKLWYPFRKKTLANLESNVHEVREHLKLAIQILQLDTETESRQLLISLTQQANDIIASVTRISEQSQRILDQHMTESFQRITAWLSPADPWTNHDTARQLHLKQTGDWLLQHERYKKWRTGELSHFWMHGRAGCGKTILFSVVTEDIHAHCSQTLNTAYAIFYFSFSEERKRSDVDLLRSLVTQLGCRDPALSLLRIACEQAKRGIPDSEELERLLVACIQAYDRVFVLVDALDECPEAFDVREAVLKLIERLTRKAPNLKIFASSREMTAIRQTMEIVNSESMEIDTMVVDVDIERYVSSQLSSDPKFRRLDAKMRDLIEQTIVAKSDGMFRWACCQLRELAKLKSTKPKYVREVLKALPATLDDTYAQMLCGIDEMYYQDAITLLRWLAYARSPPTLAELVEAAIIDPDAENSVDEENRGVLEDVVNILAGLVTVETPGCVGEQCHTEVSKRSENRRTYTVKRHIASDNPLNRHHKDVRGDHVSGYPSQTRVRLAHFSVKEYLESKRILSSRAKHFALDGPKSHRFITHSCLAYLRHYSASVTEGWDVRDSLTKFPLLRYSAESWIYHSALQRSDDVDCETSFLRSGQAWADWLTIREALVATTGLFMCRVRRDKNMIDLHRDSSYLYSATTTDLWDVVRIVFRIERTDDTWSGRQEAQLSLIAASYFGWKNLVLLLLNHGVDVNGAGGSTTSALYAASNRGHDEVVQLLLARGADINMICSFNGDEFLGTPLSASLSHFSTVHVLLNHGANANVVHGVHYTALELAAANGDPDLVLLLLQFGADPNVSAGRHNHRELPLHAAAACGHTKAVQLLLDHGARIDAMSGVFGTALAAAAALPSKKTVQLLLDRGATIQRNNQTAKFRRDWPTGPLQLASFLGNEEVVQLLLARGADVNWGIGFDSPLQLALRMKHERVIQLLRAAGAVERS